MATRSKKSSPTRKTRKTGLSAKKLREIKTYARKGYSANRIQKKMRQRHMGVRRKTILRIVRETKGRPQRPNPEKYVRRKYRKSTVAVTAPTRGRSVSYTSFGVKGLAVYDGNKRIQMRGTGRDLYNAMKIVVKHPPKEQFLDITASEVLLHPEMFLEKGYWRGGRPQVESR
jgi:hypothetical protein